MSSIDKLASVSDLSSADKVALFSAQLGNDAAATLAVLLAWLQAQLTAESGFVTQYAAPGATGFSVTVAPPTAGASVFLLLSQGGAYAAGTLILPAGVDGQEILVHSRQAVTALTVTPASGNALSGAPTTLAAASFFRLRFDGVNSLWCRVG
jgi:hypothetical protein